MPMRSFEPVLIALLCLYAGLLSNTALAAQDDPILSLDVDRPFVEVGDQTRLSWASSRAASCEAAGNWSGSQPVEGSVLSPVFERAALYGFSLECSSSTASRSKQVFVQAVDPAVPMSETFVTPVTAEPMVIPHEAAFSAKEWIWEITFDINALKGQQTLVSYDENKQSAAGHTTISVNRKGLVEVRHQGKTTGSYTVQSKSRVKPGREHVLQLRMLAGVGMEMHLDGEYQDSSRHAFGTEGIARDLVLGASCQSCRQGTNAPLRYPLNGSVTLKVLHPQQVGALIPDGIAEITAADSVGAEPNPVNPGPAPTSTRGAAFPAVSAPTVIPFQSAFADSSIQWVATVALNSVGEKQTIFSYDEAGQRNAGHTTLEVVANGRIRLRHQNAGSDSIRLMSKTRLKPSRSYTIAVTMRMGELLSLDVDGIREAQANRAFGTLQAELPLVLGASCAQCRPGTLKPLVNPLDGTVALRVNHEGAVTAEHLAVNEAVAPVVAPESAEPASEPELPTAPVVVAEPAPVAVTEPPSVATAPEPTEPEPTTPEPVEIQVPEPALSLSSATAQVTAGESVRLTWTSENADQCTASGAWSGTQPLSGTKVVTPTASQRSYMMRCTGPSGSTLSMVTINVDRLVRVSWREPAQAQDAIVSGYRLHVGERSGDYSGPIEVANSSQTDYTLALSPGVWFFAVSSLSGDHESALSEEVRIVIPQS